MTFVCDSGNKYLSKMYNDYWMLDQGFIERERHGDLRDLISRHHDERATVTVGPEDTLLTALGRMKLYDISQIPRSKRRSSTCLSDTGQRKYVITVRRITSGELLQ